MMNRRVALGMLVAAGVTSTGMAAPKQKQKLHHNGQSFLGDKIKQNGKHKIHKAGKSDVLAEVNNGKVVNVSASGMQVKKVKSKRKMAEADASVILASMQMAQADVYYYGYWVYDDDADYYYWFPAEYVVVDSSWVEFVA
jgi:hypothetical protein